MTISFHLPDRIANHLLGEFVDVGEALKEAVFVERYWQGKLSHAQFAEGLGISRNEADAVLKRHGVTEDLVSAKELDEQTAGLRMLLGE